MATEATHPRMGSKTTVRERGPVSLGPLRLGRLADPIWRRFWWRFHRREILGAGVAVLIAGIIAGAALAWADEQSHCNAHPFACNVVSDALVVVAGLAFGWGTFRWKVHRIIRSFTALARSRPEQMLGLEPPPSLIGQPRYVSFYSAIARDLLAAGVVGPGKGVGARNRSNGKMIVGGAGTGKTRAAIGLTAFLAEQGVVPVLISLERRGTPLSLVALAREQFLNSVDTWTLFGDQGERVFARLRRDGRMVIVADGLEGALPDATQSERDALLVAAIEEALHAGDPVVATTRHIEVAQRAGTATFPLPRLTLDDARAAMALPRQAFDVLRERLVTAELAENSFYVNVAATVARFDGLVGWEGSNRISLRASLLDRYIDGVIQCRVQPHVDMNPRERGVIVDALSLVARRLLARGRTSESLEYLVQATWEVEQGRGDLADGARRLADGDVARVIDGGRILGFLHLSPPGSIHFLHADMLAYLASRSIRASRGSIFEFGRAAAIAEAATAVVMAAVCTATPRPSRNDRARGRAAALGLISAAGDRSRSAALGLISAAGDRSRSASLLVAAAAKIAWACDLETSVRDKVARAAGASRNGGDPLERIQLVNELGELETPEAFKELWLEAQGPNFDVRLAAVEVLRKGGDLALGVLEPKIDDALAEVPGAGATRRSVVRALGTLGLVLPALAGPDGTYPAGVEDPLARLESVDHPSVEIDVARGLKATAMNDSLRAPPVERLWEILADTKSWYARICLIHAVAAKAVNAGGSVLEEALGTLRKIALDRNEHAFVREASRQVAMGLQTKNLIRYVWDEAEILRPSGLDSVARELADRHAPETTYLKAEVGLAMNLTFSSPPDDTGKDDYADEIERLRVWNQTPGLPHCFDRSRSRREIFEGCPPECAFRLCPLRVQRRDVFKAEFSESFCRKLRDLRLRRAARPRWLDGWGRWRGVRRFWATFPRTVRQRGASAGSRPFSGLSEREPVEQTGPRAGQDDQQHV